MDESEVGVRLFTTRFLVLCAASLAYFMALGSTWPVVPPFVVALTNRPGGFVFCAVTAAVALALTGPILRPDKYGRDGAAQ